MLCGRPIYVIRLGTGPKEVFYSGSFHANEWITSTVLMKFVEDYAIAYRNNSTIYGYSIRNLFNSTSIYVMPMVNSDGVDLVTNTFKFNSWIYEYTRNIANNFPDISYPDGWKANIRGVDFKNFQPFSYYNIICI